MVEQRNIEEVNLILIKLIYSCVKKRKDLLNHDLELVERFERIIKRVFGFYLENFNKFSSFQFQIMKIWFKLKIN